MKSRNVLRAQFWRAWSTTISKRYDSQLINSERGLQGYFCAALLDEFAKSNPNRRLFIEPKLSFASGASGRHPDVVVCDTKQIVGIVELKYVPRGRPAYAKDLETLRLAVENAKTLKLSNERFRGVSVGSRPYPLAEDAVLCWAAVYAGDAMDLRPYFSGSDIGSRFLQLNAVTAAGKLATLSRLQE